MHQFIRRGLFIDGITVLGSSSSSGCTCSFCLTVPEFAGSHFSLHSPQNIFIRTDKKSTHVSLYMIVTGTKYLDLHMDINDFSFLLMDFNLDVQESVDNTIH